MSLTATAIFVSILYPFAPVFSLAFLSLGPSSRNALFIVKQQHRYYSSSSRPSLLAAFNAMSFGQASSTSTTVLQAMIDTEEREFDATLLDDNKEDSMSPRPYWDPVAQVYVGGIIPENEKVREIIESEGGVLRLFGYGSLCWNPGTGVLANARVTSQPGRCKGYRRCWAQKSTDHRGRPQFPGIVCTLLTSDEVLSIRHLDQITLVDDGLENATTPEIWTEGLLYEIPRDLVAECLAELDFREKGGYARDIITVVEDATGDEHPALLYRGTRDNPAFWPRSFVDAPYAAAVMSVAQGPSGHNDVYLHQLNTFLKVSSSSNSSCDSGSGGSSNGNCTLSISASSLETCDDTVQLARMVKTFQENNQLYFLFGCGSNQHNQLLLDLQSRKCSSSSSNNNNNPTTNRNYAQLLHGHEDAHEMMEIVLCTDKQQQNSNHDDPRAKQVLAGGGHCALLTQGGSLFLFGWNESGQCGFGLALSVEKEEENDASLPLPTTRALQGVPGGIETCALGFDHTVVVERGTGRVYTFGNNRQGQVDGKPNDSCCKQIETPITPVFLKEQFVIDVACGLFHSAAITRDGEVLVWGGNATHAGRWTPPDNRDVRFIRVACGRNYSVALDNMGRVWTIGSDNKYGQLGRQEATSTTTTAYSNDNERQQPMLVHSPWEDDNVLVSEISCGWSHTVVLAKRKQDKNNGANDDDDDDSPTVAYGWGRNDKGQLGTGTTANVLKPIRLFESFQNEEQQQQRRQKRRSIKSVSCGSEFTVVVVEERDSPNPSEHQLWSCGWNEHGNLGVGNHPERQHQHHQQQQQQQQGDSAMNLNNKDVLQLTKMVGAPVANPPGYSEDAPISVAAGGAHVLAMRTVGV